MALLLFLVLQACDFGTTLRFLGLGVREANPLAAVLLRLTVHPAAALLLLKAAGCGLGVYAWKSSRLRLLRRANVFFGLCVAWNLLAITAA